MRPSSISTRAPQPAARFRRGSQQFSHEAPQLAITPATSADELGFMGLRATLAGFRENVPAAMVLLTGMIHAMGGAPTSVARGAYLNFRI